jgi:protein-disulfide isomerase
MRKVLLLLLICGCVTKKQLSKVLSENPDIVFDVITKNPAKFFQVVQTASESYQQEVTEKSYQQSFEDPLKPELSKDRVLVGDDAGVIDLVEYSDFECPYCARGYQVVEELLSKYKGKIRFTYKHLPLSMHEHAMIASQYFEAVLLQSKEKAYQFFKEVYENQKELVDKGETYLKQVVKTVGADAAKVAKDINSDAVKNQIEKDSQEAASFGISGTPGFLINGIPVRGAYPLDHFEGVLKTLQEKGSLTL